MRRLVIAAMALTAGSPLAAAESCVMLDSKSVAALFDDWNFSLSSLDADQVVQRYWPNAVLLPTVSNTPRTNPAMIGDYFEHFLAKRPRGRIDTRTVQGGCNVAMDMGTYTFSLMDDKGVTSEVAARYTFVYQYRDGAWKILHHHSSAMPEGGASAAPTDAHAAAEKPAEARKPVQAAHAAPAPAPTPIVHSPPKAVAKVAPKPVAAPAPEAKSAAVVKPPAEAKAPVEAKTTVEAKTAMFANLASSPPPSKFYPPEAAKRKERGNVNLKVCADVEGGVAGTPEVLKSSGSKLLDEAAQSWARAAKWVPATLNNRRVEGCTQVDVAFEAAA
jgi:uncharacterized protein (TIGR02246 family)